jgi:hypothetical protein
MRYRLGSFRPRLGSSDYADLLEVPELAAPMTTALEEMLRLRLSRPALEAPAAHTDLLQALEADHPDRPWVEAVHGGMRRVTPNGLPLRLLACEYEPGPEGFLTLAASAPGIRVEVFPNDWMQIGFAVMRQGDDPVRAWPRLLREVCANGSLVCIAELERHEGTVGIAAAVDRYLTPEHYAIAIQGLRDARQTAVTDPREYLDEFQRLQPDLARSYLNRIIIDHQSGDDDSLYGLMNAITATARKVDDWGDRLDLEEFAGQIAWLRRPVPSRSGRGALVTT